jgi:ribosome biogenesis GTPase A
MTSSKKPEMPQAETENPSMEVDGVPVYNWFPGHMLKAIRDIKAKMAIVDLVIEIRDARAPLASGNRHLNESISGKSRLILLNKVNLADPLMVSKWGAWFKAQGQPHLFMNCLEKTSVKTLLSLSRKIIEDKRRANNPEGIKPKTKYRFMIIGLPNTGKSTFINLLAARHATKTADKPGQTRMQIWVNVGDDLELLDTPGVMPPAIDLEEHKYWLSALNAIPENVIGVEASATFLVKYFMNAKTKEFKERYKLENFNLDLDETFAKIAKARGCLGPKGVLDLDRVYKLILHDFRAGELGKSCFEFPPIKI